MPVRRVPPTTWDLGNTAGILALAYVCGAFEDLAHATMALTTALFAWVFH